MNKSWVIVIIISLTFGLIAGYMLWGKKAEDKLDAKQLLNRAIQEVEIIENKNKELEDRLKNMQDSRKEAERLSKENIAIQDQLKKAQQDNLQLENLISQVQDELSNVKEEIQIQEGLQTLSKDLKAKISGLEKENQDLWDILDRIGSLTRGQADSPEGIKDQSTGTSESPGQ